MEDCDLLNPNILSNESTENVGISEFTDQSSEKRREKTPDSGLHTPEPLATEETQSVLNKDSITNDSDIESAGSPLTEATSLDHLEEEGVCNLEVTEKEINEKEERKSQTDDRKRTEEVDIKHDDNRPRFEK